VDEVQLVEAGPTGLEEEEEAGRNWNCLGAERGRRSCSLCNKEQEQGVEREESKLA
jgi:hypothetical protein